MIFSFKITNTNTSNSHNRDEMNPEKKMKRTQKKKRKKKEGENEVVQWKNMEKVRWLEVQVVASGEGLQANQADSDRSEVGGE